jgi:uncharacterized RDD family membrane protein YckC
VPPGYAPQPGYGPGPGYVPGYRAASAPLPPLASWGQRAGAALLDLLLFLACILPGILVAVIAGNVDAAVGLSDAVNFALLGLFVVLLVGGVALSLVNQTWRQGTRGQSWGKRVVGIRLVREHDLQPPGGGLAVARFAIRAAFINATCGLYLPITFLAPLWDSRNRTLDDKIVQTLVIQQPRP